MITANIGWAVSWDLAGNGVFDILKTDTGGHYWQTVLLCLPTPGLGPGYPCTYDFHSALVATILFGARPSGSGASCGRRYNR
jgi:hypothetical protein